MFWHINIADISDAASAPAAGSCVHYCAQDNELRGVEAPRTLNRQRAEGLTHTCRHHARHIALLTSLPAHIGELERSDSRRGRWAQDEQDEDEQEKEGEEGWR